MPDLSSAVVRPNTFPPNGKTDLDPTESEFPDLLCSTSVPPYKPAYTLVTPVRRSTLDYVAHATARRRGCYDLQLCNARGQTIGARHPMYYLALAERCGSRSPMAGRDVLRQLV